ncbi:transcriptional regulator [Longimycelium tulufanense]|uniref:Transcriptional regulator n=1 Tax=Longimycelium tulufanense TaxID=907463 RepID=A0A8J3C9F4_9PSEU|nr:LysR family transcriptional regulator [Longimycelium tulufanense]GGM33882.1 transcriptional regulator [Longimycelium tulufanense]
MDWRDLEAFRAVAEELSFTRAASRMHITQPALSARIRRLERRLGVPLLHRSTRRVALSDRGERLLHHILRLDRMWHHALADVTEKERRFVLVTAVPELGSVVEAASREYPGLTLEHVLAPADAALPSLELGEHDAVQGNDRLFHPLPTPPNARTETIVHEPVWVMLPVSHRLAARPVVPLSELAGEAWIEHPCARDELTRLCAAAGFQPDIRYHGSTMQLVEHLRGGRAVSLIAARVRPPAGCVVRPLDVDVRRRLFFAWHVDSPGDVAALLLRELRQRYWELAAGNPAYHAFIRSQPHQFRELTGEPAQALAG